MNKYKMFSELNKNREGQKIKYKKAPSDGLSFYQKE